MSDDNDEFLSFSAAPIPAAIPKQKKQTTKTSIKLSRRKVSDSETVYGEDLFQMAWKPEKSIWVCFWPYTKNHIRISKDQYRGKFAIQYNVNSKDDSDLLLYHFTPSLDWEYPIIDDPQNPGKTIFDMEVELDIHIDETIRVYGPFISVEDIKLKIMSILRAEVLMGKKQDLKDLLKIEAAEKAEKERLEDESEKLTDELAAAGILNDQKQSNITPTTDFITPIQDEQETPVKISEEEKDASAKIVKDRSGATVKLTPIVY